MIDRCLGIALPQRLLTLVRFLDLWVGEKQASSKFAPWRRRRFPCCGAKALSCQQGIQKSLVSPARGTNVVKLIGLTKLFFGKSAEYIIFAAANRFYSLVLREKVL